MEVPSWFNDARFVLFVIAIIYIIYLHYKYVSPIEDSCKGYKATIRDMSADSIRPVIENKVKSVIRAYIKENKGMLNDRSIEQVRCEIKDKVVDSVSNKISEEFVFDDLPEEAK